MPHAKTRTLASLNEITIDSSLGYIFALSSTEERSQSSVWRDLRTGGLVCAAVVEQFDERIVFEGPGAVMLTDDDGLYSALPKTDTIHLDVSGFDHHVWAPLLRVCLHKYETVNVLYTEPSSYRPHESPASPTVFDLSLKFRGVIPLPGFARFGAATWVEQPLFVPMLGFEGKRPVYLAEEISPSPRVIPVVGVPGFRIEYPAFTIACNRDFLLDYQASSEIRLAQASCPFQVLEILDGIRADYPDSYMYLAPVGTKPHSVAAVKYALDNPDTTELIYDNPVRKPGRTVGVGVTHVYTLKGDPLNAA